MEEEAEYGFWHVLVRDVCYAQIPRAARAARHRAAVTWIERKAAERLEDVADVLAYHYLQALELGRAAGADVTAELEEGAIRYLALAGERALALDVDRAEQSLSNALEFAPAGHPERASLLERWAQAAQLQGRFKEARDALEEALAFYRQQGQVVTAGRVLTALSNVLQTLGDPRQHETLAEALALLEAEPPGSELVTANAALAVSRGVGADHPEAIAAAGRALALAAELGCRSRRARSASLGYARCYLGEQQGLEDMRRALELALEQGQGRDAASLHNNLAIVTWQYEGPQAALDACREGIDFCQRRGITAWALDIAAMTPTFLAEIGQATQALAEAEPLAERLQAAGDVVFAEPRSLQLLLLAERGEQERAPAPDELVARARESGEPQMLALAVAAAARLLLVQGRPQQAQALLVELEQVARIRSDPYFTSVLLEVVRAALALENPELAARLVDGVQPVTPLARARPPELSGAAGRGRRRARRRGGALQGRR